MPRAPKRKKPPTIKYSHRYDGTLVVTKFHHDSGKIEQEITRPGNVLSFDPQTISFGEVVNQFAWGGASHVSWLCSAPPIAESIKKLNVFAYTKLSGRKLIEATSAERHDTFEEIRKAIGERKGLDSTGVNLLGFLEAVDALAPVLAPPPPQLEEAMSWYFYEKRCQPKNRGTEKQILDQMRIDHPEWKNDIPNVPTMRARLKRFLRDHTELTPPAERKRKHKPK